MIETLDNLLRQMVAQRASDLHLAINRPPMLRIDGDLAPIANSDLCTKTDMDGFLKTVMNESQYTRFTEQLEIDFSYAVENLSRFRANVYTDSQGAAIALRAIPEKIPHWSTLDFPPIFEKLCQSHNGLILVTGPTGSGKSTTLAAMIDYINERFEKHILTIEDPVEFYHDSKKCLVNQRELGRSTHSFSAALKSALREDPDVILVGELRDIETIRLALTAAETGHLVLATLHTSSAAKTVNRIIDVFPAGEKSMVRSMLSSSLQAVIAQVLIKKKGGSGRVAAREIMICSAAVRNLIREDKIPQIYSVIQTGQSLGMITLEKAIEQLVEKNMILPVNIEEK